MQPQYIYKALVSNVVDGDTIDVNLDLGFDITVNTRLRLYGIDTPEIRTRDLVEKAEGKKATALVEEKILGKEVVLKIYKADKYGRYLADVYIDDECLNKTLVEQGLAKEYFGGTKT